MQPPRIVRYTPESAINHPAQLLRSIASNARAAIPLAYMLFQRDMKAQFRQSILSYGWLFLPPIATTGVWFFLNSSGVVRVANTGIPYPAFVLIGTLLWQSFIDSVSKPIQRLSASKGILTKLNIPREAPVLAGMGETVVTAMVRLLLLIPIFLFVNLHLSWHALLFPLGYFALLLTGSAIGVVLTPLGLLFNDVGRGIQIGGQFAMYLAPVVYPVAQEGALATINRWNPVTPLIEFSRATLSGGPLQDVVATSIVTGCSLILLFFGWIVLQIVLPRIIERLGM